MRALLIEWNETTGKRAGNINPRDRNFQCYGWQYLHGSESLEIRLVMDGKVDNFRNVPGITVLENDDEIDAAIEKYIPGKAGIISETILIEAMKEKKLPISDLLDKNMDEITQYAIDNKLAGVKKREVRKLKDVIR